MHAVFYTTVTNIREFYAIENKMKLVFICSRDYLLNTNIYNYI